MLAESQRQKSAPCSHVTPVSRSSKVVLQKCEELLAVCLIALWCNIVQTRLERYIIGVIHPDCVSHTHNYEQEGRIKSSSERKVLVMPVRN
jgi:hypothetical protein